MLTRLFSLLRQIPWLSSFLLLWLASLAYILCFDSNLWFSTWVFSLGSLTSLASFYNVSLYYSSFPKLGQKILAPIIAVGLLITLLTNFFIFVEFGQFINASMINFILKDLLYLKDYFVTYLLSPYALLLLLFLAGFSALWWPKKEQTATFSLKRLSAAIFLSLVLIFVCDVIRKSSSLYHIPMTASTATGLIECSLNTMNRQSLVYPLYKSERLTVQPATVSPENLPNIIVILHESMSKTQGLPFYGHSDNAMPYFNQFIHDNKDQFFIFESGFTNSTATDVSVPSLMTGVGTHESGTTLHTMPLIWDWAKAAGKDSFILSSQRFSWARFDDFLFSESLTIHKTAEAIDAPVVNDLGIDDIRMIQELPAILEALDTKRGFVGVINTNSLHGPIAQTSAELSTQPNHEKKVMNALTIVDHSMKDMLNTLAPYLDNTILIFSSDHGEKSPYTDHKTHRIYGFYEEYFAIPFLMYVPESYQKANPDIMKHMSENVKKNVQNIDIVPTIVDLLRLNKTNSNLLQQFKGSSIAGPLASNRPIVGLNTNDSRCWNQEGFGIAIADHRLVASNVSGIFYGNIKTDPKQKQNDWHTMSKENKKSLLSFIHQNVYLSRIWDASLQAHEDIH